MNDRCSRCLQTFEPEPGFYYGAMFISYIMTAWLFIVIGLFLVFSLGWAVRSTMMFMILLALGIHTLCYRLSRSIWIHMFVKYDAVAQERVGTCEHTLGST